MLWSETPTETWPPQTRNVNPYQKEIEFFWPLTEQIELDLDYTRAYKYDQEKNNLITNIGQSLVIANASTDISWTAPSSIITARITAEAIETPELVFTLNKKPNIIKRFIYKIVGLKWKIK